VYKKSMVNRLKCGIEISQYRGRYNRAVGIQFVRGLVVQRPGGNKINDAMLCGSVGGGKGRALANDDNELTKVFGVRHEVAGEIEGMVCKL
jgi:hypothetical protein